MSDAARIAASPVATASKPSCSAGDERWSGHSRLAALWEVAISVVLGFCALLTVLTTVGIVLVLSVQTVEFFVTSKIGSSISCSGPS